MLAKSSQIVELSPMQINALPHFDDSVNTTGCCPKFNPKGWDAQALEFKDKKFIRAETRCAMHIPLNMGKVFARVQGHLDEAKAYDPDNFIVLSHELSPWKAEHFFSVDCEVAGEEPAQLSGRFLTKLFEGPYKQAKIWHTEMETVARANGAEPGNIYFFYTTCPKCAKAYDKNYVVGVVEMSD
jgi:hypothetical protein